MKTIITLVLSMSLFVLNAQESIELKDFNVLNDTNWKGTLIYKNYGDGKQVTLKTEMQIKIENDKIVYSVQYPDEPKANSILKKKIRKNGTYFGSEQVLEKTILVDGRTKIVTSFKGKDNNKKSTMYLTYIFNDKEISIEKQVQYYETNEKFTRNKQSYKRI